MTIESPNAIPDGLIAARDLGSRGSEAEAPRWALTNLTGRFVEVTGTPQSSAVLTAVVGLLRTTQERGEYAAWVAAPDSTFYPPDLLEAGVDLATLPVIRPPSPQEMARAADVLLRSGGLALLVLDWGAHPTRLNFNQQNRLSGLAQRHDCLLLALSQTGAGAVRSSLASLRTESAGHRLGRDHFRCELRAVKDKRHPPGWTYQTLHHGPDGLC